MTTLSIESLNVGLPRKEHFFGKEVLTGICKQPVNGSVNLRTLGFEGDGVADGKRHGGQDKAVCVYSLEHYPYWEKTLGIPMPVAAFGENLTVSHMHEDDICIGDVFRLGSALVQVSQPRQPCRTLAARYGRSDLLKLVVDSGRTGIYLRVLEEGVVEKGSSLFLRERDRNGVTVSFANHVFHHDRNNCTGIDTVLSVVALSASWRESFETLRERCA